MKPIIIALLFILSGHVQALETVSLSLASLHGNSWHTEGVAIELSDINKKAQQLTLIIHKLQLPAPFSDFSLINIRCTDFSWHADELHCQQGRASLDSTRWQTHAANFSFTIQKNRVTFQLTDLHWLEGIASIDGEVQNDNWSIRATMKSADGKTGLALLPFKAFTLNTGKVSFQLDATGSQDRIDHLALTTELKQLTGQTATGQFATEKLDLNAQIKAQNANDVWQWQAQAQLKAGALYSEPLYIKPDIQAINLNADGVLNIAQQAINIETMTLQHPQTGTLSGSATLNYQKQLNLEQAKFTLHSNELQKLAIVYFKPFFTPTFLDSLGFTGQLDAEFAMTGISITALSANFNQLAINDTAGRIKLQQGNGTLNWSGDKTVNQPSFFAWQQLQVYGLPIGHSQLKFLTNAGNFQLLGNTQLPFLGGDIRIKQFKIQTDADTKVYFEGELVNISLQQLSAALKWQPMSGTLNGRIPQVSYANQTLKLEGEFIIKVFDGIVKISRLAATRLFSGSPNFSSEVEIDQLDLEQLTSKYQFGSITGKLSGFIKQLQIENGQPVSFLAWLGTPDNDDSTHRISQKAVNNIAQIGGSGTSDLISRSFLSLFDTFGYDKIGLGCYLHAGVCQLSGVEATESGYAIVKGGGVPRIEVIAYNTRLDWAVLMQRLARISTTDNVIIQ